MFSSKANVEQGAVKLHTVSSKIKSPQAEVWLHKAISSKLKPPHGEPALMFGQMFSSKVKTSHVEKFLHTISSNPNVLHESRLLLHASSSKLKPVQGEPALMFGQIFSSKVKESHAERFLHTISSNPKVPHDIPELQAISSNVNAVQPPDLPTSHGDSSNVKKLHDDMLSQLDSSKWNALHGCDEFPSQPTSSNPKNAHGASPEHSDSSK